MPKWTKEQEDQLRKLSKTGLSLDEISKLMEMSRGMVSGKLNRMNLKKHNRKPVIKVIPVKIIPTQYQSAGGIRMEELTKKGCRFSTSNHNDKHHLFCGKPSTHGSSYCAEHKSVCVIVQRESV